MDLLRLDQILATLALLFGAIFLSYLIIRKSRIPRMDRIIIIEVAVFLIVAGVLDYLNLYGVETRMASTLARWLFFSALLATSFISMISKSRGSKRS